MKPRAQEYLFAALLAPAALALYVRTLAPGVVDADGGEFQFAAWNFSFVHPTGYPLYLILGGLFQHLVPFGDPAYRLNLFTALTAALAVAVLYLVVHTITGQRLAALVASASFAVTRTFWFDANAAETYDLNAFFVALLLLLALRWQAKPRASTFALFAFASGLALTHHRTVVLWVAPFAIFFVLRIAYSVLRQDRGPKTDDRKRLPFLVHSPSSVLGLRSWFLRITLYVLLLLLPLLLYLYIPLRAPVSPYAALELGPGRAIVLYDNTPAGFVNYVMGRVFQSELGWDAVSAVRLAAFPQALLDQFGALGVLLGIAGLLVMVRRKDWERLALLILGFLAVIAFASAYHIGDIFHYYIPAYLVWAIWIGIGIAHLTPSPPPTPQAPGVMDLKGRESMFPSLKGEGLRVRWIAAACFIFLVLPQLVLNYSAADRSQETGAREQWTRILAAPVPPNAILISNDRDEMMPLWYIQYVEHTRRDVLGLFPLLTPAPAYANISRLTDSVLDAGRPVLFVKPMPGMEIKYNLAQEGPLVRVVGRAADAPPRFPGGAVLGGKLRVAGYDWVRDSGRLRVSVYWQAVARVEGDYTAFVQLLDARGDKVGQGNDHQVGGNFYPTSLWDTGEILRDEQEIKLAPNLAPGTYHLVAGMYRQPDLEPLADPVEIGMIEWK